VYRAAGLHAIQCQADLADETSVLACLLTMNAKFKPHASGVIVQLDGIDVTRELRSEATAAAASKVAAMQGVRASLLDEQRSFRVAPGLVADGRDMGTVVFPDAVLKVFLSANSSVRADRRAKQLKEKGIQVNMPALLQEICTRDERDSSREHSPMAATEDALVIDSSEMAISDVVDQILRALQTTADESI